MYDGTMNITSKLSKVIPSGIMLLIGALSLTGCVSSDAAPGDEQGNLVVRSVELPSGNYVDCVASNFTANAVSPSCDWEHSYSSSERSPSDNGNLYAYAVEIPAGGEVICVASNFTANMVYPSCDWDAVKR